MITQEVLVLDGVVAEKPFHCLSCDFVLDCRDVEAGVCPICSWEFEVCKGRGE
jgi:hypothetical protein